MKCPQGGSWMKCHEVCVRPFEMLDQKCGKLDEVMSCHKGCGMDAACHHTCPKMSNLGTDAKGKGSGHWDDDHHHGTPGSFPFQTPKAAAETARWIVSSASWGYVTTLDNGSPVAEVLSFSDGAETSTGRLFFYMMGGEGDKWDASLTISQAALNHTTSCEVQKIDPEDPRCAKITFSGEMIKAKGNDLKFAKEALFARHPQMKTWPASHHFTVYELVVSHIWMIAFYGGGATVTPEMYYAVQPKHNVPTWPP